MFLMLVSCIVEGCITPQTQTQTSLARKGKVVKLSSYEDMNSSLNF
jgi:hypothetical protein